MKNMNLYILYSYILDLPCIGLEESPMTILLVPKGDRHPEGVKEKHPLKTITFNDINQVLKLITCLDLTGFEPT